MLVLVGASASGKTEIAKIIIRKYNFKKLVTTTTRPKRPGEQDGVDYHFLDEATFQSMKEQGVFIETTTYNGYHYGTAFSETGWDKVLIVNVEGANSLYEKIPHAMVIFLLHSPETLREARMLSRGDDPRTIQQRLKKDTALFRRDRLTHVDHIIENSRGLSLESLADTIHSLYMNALENQA
ncbi:MAG: guanylate kinase [Bacillota bacterium]